MTEVTDHRGDAEAQVRRAENGLMRVARTRGWSSGRRPAIRAALSAATRILRVSVSPRLSVVSATSVISRTRKTAPATLSQL